MKAPVERILGVPAPESETGRPVTLPLVAAAAVVMGYVVGAGPAMWLIGAGLVMLGIAVRAPQRLLAPAVGERIALGIVVAGLALHFTQLLSRTPGFLLEVSPADLTLFRAGVSAGVLLVAAAVFARERIARTSFVLVVVVHCLLGLWIFRQSPSPGIDVYVWQDKAIEALRRGENSYGLGYPEAHPGTYPAGMVFDGEVRGYAYPPLTLVAALPAHLAGDLRLAYLVAAEATGLLIGFTSRTRLARAAGALFLFIPGLFVVLQLSWTEPLLSFAFAGTVFAAVRGQKTAAAVLFGLTLSVKQYFVLAVAVMHKLFGLPFALDKHVRRLATAMAVVALTLLPWLVWDPGGLWRGLVLFPLRTPFREDSFSFPAAIVREGGPHLPSWVVIAALVVTWLLSRTAPSTPAGFCTSTALVLTSTFAWSTHAFSNYYFFVFGVLCCALASAASRRASPTVAVDRSGAPAPAEV